MSNQVYVWDLFVRLFHWSLVVLFITSYVSGEEEHWIHVYSGYAIVILVSLRVMWGFVGSKHAKFKDFVSSPKIAIQYLKSMRAGNAERFLGHNPAGGMMVVALLATLVLATLSGMKLYAVEEGKGPLAQDVNLIVSQAYADSDYDKHDEHEEAEESASEELWEGIHKASTSLAITLVMLHVIGVFVSGRQHNEFLVKAMFTGRKDEFK